MNFVKNYASSLGVLALAVGLTASQGSAQSVKGTFNLPFQAHWGDAVLEPGNYTISLPSEGSLSRVMEVSGEGKTIMVLLGMSQRTNSERGFLRIENIGQTQVIRELNTGAAGRLIRFPVPKSVRNQMALESRARDTTVAVASSGGN